MPTDRFNHKYSHCRGLDCPVKDDCIHFLAYQEALEQKLTNISIQTHCNDINQGYVRVRIEKN